MKLTFTILCLASLIPCWAEDNNLSGMLFATSENALVSLPVSSENEAFKWHLNQGLQNCILGYREKTVYHFNQAIATEPDNVLAHVCKMLVYSSNSEEYRESLQVSRKLLGDAILTPLEEWYVSTFLQRIAGDMHGAAKAFTERAATYRRDFMAGCFDVYLNAYMQEQGGNIISRAETLIERNPDNPLAYYLRALLEERSSTPSQRALECAGKAAELFPESPCTHLLLGHLQRRSGLQEPALSSFSRARELFLSDSGIIPLSEATLYRTSSLSEICAYWETGQKSEALKRCLSLTKEVSASMDGEGDILMNWEARTLPLRLLVLQPVAPSSAAIKAATKACNAPQNSTIELVQNCLVAAIQARALADAGRPSLAQQTLNKASHHFDKLSALSDTMIKQGGVSHTCFSRSLRACTGAILRAKVALYTDSTSIWQPHLDELLAQPEIRFLPPVLPRLP